MTLTDGMILKFGEINAHGGPEAPLSDVELLEKLHFRVRHAFPPDRICAFWAMRDALLDPATKFASLGALVYPETEAQ